MGEAHLAITRLGGIFWETGQIGILRFVKLGLGLVWAHCCILLHCIWDCCICISCEVWGEGFKWPHVVGSFGAIKWPHVIARMLLKFNHRTASLRGKRQWRSNPEKFYGTHGKPLNQHFQRSISLDCRGTLTQHLQWRVFNQLHTKLNFSGLPRSRRSLAMTAGRLSSFFFGGGNRHGACAALDKRG